VRVPSAAVDVPVPPTSHLQPFHVFERYGLVWSCLEEPATGIPEIAAEDDPACGRINSGVETWKASANRMTDNFMGISHCAHMHAGTFGLPDNALVPTISIEALDDDFYSYRNETEVANERGDVVRSRRQGNHPIDFDRVQPAVRRP